ncbi:MAG: carbamoyl-phosphate synthase large subunit [Acidobacteria bacterium]|nr:MAG: carbamoyl-phosphate synthase large subunit [Acidobacteriota bacterium]
MRPRKDIRKVLVIGSGPIVIGQACEFDYSGTQALKALAEEGVEVVLVNSNPATIMTDPEIAARTYVEPLVPEVLERILEQERPDALLPTVGGQTALNLAVELDRTGALERYGVEMVGVKREAVEICENRERFREAVESIGLEMPRGGFATSVEEAERLREPLGWPVVVRPSYTLGGTGGGVAWNAEEFREVVSRGLDLSPIHQVLVEESIIGWKEYELEVMRDRADNVVIVCSIENFDAMGVHTGDSVTVAPAQTLTDREYQRMRDAALAVIRRVGVETGGSNIQFAVDPRTGRLLVIEMNPRVSRSSALASKATGFPIARIAAKLALGYTLDEIPNDITKETPASFEPSIDYVVVKVPRWAFEKFPATPPDLGTQMKSVGEAMAIGRTFPEALQKALRSLETGRYGLGGDGTKVVDPHRLGERLATPNWQRLFYIKHALLAGWPVEKIADATQVDPWFLRQISDIVDVEGKLRAFTLEDVPEELLLAAKRLGFSDRQLSILLGCAEEELRRHRWACGLRPVYKRVDTCAAEFEAHTPYLYSTYEEECEAHPTGRRKVMVLGSGPNRIGQGIEFDYCCVHASFALREAGIESIMVNCNPETVSTDYDTSDRLYFEPLTLEDVLEIAEKERPEGAIVQFGGQTPLKLAIPLMRAGVKILGTSPESIDLAEDRERFGALLRELDIPAPEWGTARSLEEAKEIARRIGFPLLVRPSYVLGGRAMFVCWDEDSLEQMMRLAVEASPEHPVLLDRFLEDATELDVDALCDGERVVIGAVMEHIEKAGVHSGDSTCVIPALSGEVRKVEPLLRDMTRRLALALEVRGLMNVQFAVQGGRPYVLEVNPRASRTVPFVSKAAGIPLAKVATRIMLGESLADQGIEEPRYERCVFVKEPVFPFTRFPGEDPVLGPEMKSTGEVMGIGEDLGEALWKGLTAAGTELPREGTAFLSVHDRDKPALPPVARRLREFGFHLLATKGTAEFLSERGIEVERVYKVNEGRPHVVDRMLSGEVHLVINTPLGAPSYFDERAIRFTALQRRIPLITTLAGAAAAAEAIAAMREGRVGTRALQEIHGSGGRRQRACR